MRWNVVEADQLPKKHVIVLPVDCWGKPLSKMHKALMKKNETLIKGFETDCIEGWASAGSARLYTDGDLTVIFLCVQIEPDDFIRCREWHLACVDMAYLIEDNLSYPVHISFALPDNTTFAYADPAWGQETLLSALRSMAERDGKEGTIAFVPLR